MKRVSSATQLRIAAEKMWTLKVFRSGVTCDDDAIAFAKLLDLTALLRRVEGQPLRDQILALLQTRRVALDLRLLRAPQFKSASARLCSIETGIYYSLLPKLQREASREFAKSIKLKDRGYHFGPRELLGGYPDWCESCGGKCSVQHPTKREHAELNSYYRHWTNVACVIHTRHDYERVAAFAKANWLSVRPLEWSWYGTPTAALVAI
jgi:hypothetical protein